MKNIRWLLIILTAVSLFSGCDQSGKTESLPGTVKLAVYKGDSSALVYIAQEQGYFSQNGLDVELIEFNSGKQAADALIAGKADIATSADFVFVKQAASEIDLRILGSVSSAELNWILVNTDKNIQSLNDLKGKKVGLTMGSITEYYLGLSLRSVNLDLNEIDLTDLKPAQIKKSFLNKEIDAVITWHPNIFHIKRDFRGTLKEFPAQKGNPFYFILLSKEKWLAKNQKHAAALLKALKMAEVWKENHSSEFEQFAITKFNLTQNYVKEMRTWQRFELRFPQALMLAMDGEKRWLEDNGFFKGLQAPNFLNYIEPEYLNQVSPESVTVVK